MKKLTAAIAALALFFSASASSTEPGTALNALFNSSNAKVVASQKVSKIITAAFNEEFANAGEVSWRENNGLYFGYFKQGGQDITVAYTTDGEMFAMARPVKLCDLSAEISAKLKSRYSDCTVSENTFEVVMDGQKGYYLTIENKSSVRLVKFLADGLDETVKKSKKKLVGTVS